MAKLAKQKHRIFRVLEGINNSISENEYSSNFDKLLCFFISPVLFIGAISLPFVGWLLLKRPLSDVITETIFMFSFASVFEVIPRVKMNQTLKHHAIAFLYSLIFLFCIVRYYSYVGPALWTFGFIEIVLSLSQNSKTMLVYDLAPENWTSYNVRKKRKKTNKGAERRWQERTSQSSRSSSSYGK